MIPDADGNLPIHISCTTGGFGTLKVWHELGWDFSVENSQGKSCLFLCCRYDHPKALTFLEQIGGNMFAPNKDGISGLEYCLFRGSCRCFLYLLMYRLEERYFEKPLPTDLDKKVISLIGDIASGELKFENPEYEIEFYRILYLLNHPEDLSLQGSSVMDESVQKSEPNPKNGRIGLINRQEGFSKE